MVRNKSLWMWMAVPIDVPRDFVVTSAWLSDESSHPSTSLSISPLHLHLPPLKWIVLYSLDMYYLLACVLFLTFYVLLVLASKRYFLLKVTCFSMLTTVLF